MASKYDQRGQKVDIQFNIVASEATSFSDLMKHAKDKLADLEYEDALDHLEEAKKKYKATPELLFYASLCRVAGRRPRQITYNEIKRCLRELEMAMSNDPGGAHYFVLWTIIRDDYYLTNQMYGVPTCNFDPNHYIKHVKPQYANEIKRHVLGSGNPLWELLPK